MINLLPFEMLVQFKYQQFERHFEKLKLSYFER